MKKEMRQFETGANRGPGKSKHRYPGFLSYEVIRRFGAYMHKHRIQADGELRDPDNWKKGIPKDAYLDSMFRHFLDVWELYQSGCYFITDSDGNIVDLEEALCGLMFNAQGMLYEVLKDRGDK